MSDVVAALLAGVVAGLGVAIPLGPIGVLILETGIAHGGARAAAAALGTATVDLVYALVAIVAGSVVAAVLAPVSVPVRLVSAGVLAAIAIRGLLGLRVAAPALAAQVPPGVAGTYARFVGLTAINPLTILYFGALAVGLPGVAGTAATRAAFGAGVGVGSGAWQLVLASAGTALHRRLAGRARLVTGIVGDVLILVLAAGIAASALATPR